MTVAVDLRKATDVGLVIPIATLLTINVPAMQILGSMSSFQSLTRSSLITFLPKISIRKTNPIQYLTVSSENTDTDSYAAFDIGSPKP